MITTRRSGLILLGIVIVVVGIVWGVKNIGTSKSGEKITGQSMLQGARASISPMIPEKIGGGLSQTNNPIVISSTGSSITFDDVYTIGWEGSVQYLNDQRYSYEERLSQLASHFKDNSSELRNVDSLTAKREYLAEQKYNNDQFGEERYLTRRIIYTKYDDFRIINGAPLQEYIISSQDVDIIPDEDDLVFHPTGENPRFIFAYDTKGTLAIENSEAGGEGVWLYSEGRPEVVLFELKLGNHIKETTIDIASNDVQLYTTNQYGYYQKHMLVGNLPVLKADKAHRVTLKHSDDISKVLENAYVVFHDYQGTNNINMNREKLQKELERDRTFPEMFQSIYPNEETTKFSNNTQRSHRLIDKPDFKTSKGETYLNITIPNSLASQEDYFSFAFQDVHGYRYTLPFRVFPKDSGSRWEDELTKPTRQYREGEKVATYPRMVGKLIFPYGVIEKKLQEELDDVYGNNVVIARSETNQWGIVDEIKADTIFSLEYRLPPNQSRTDQLEITDAYGDKFSWQQTFAVKDLPKYHRKASLQGSDINLLPKDGYRGSHLQVIETNMPSLQLKFTPCVIGSEPATLGMDTTREQRLLSCDSASEIVTTYDFSDEFQRWEETEHTITLPAQLANVDAFKVTILNDLFAGRERGRYHESYFFKTNVGLYAKVDDQSLYVRGRDLMTGEPITQGSLTIIDSAGKHISTEIQELGAVVELTPALIASERLVIELENSAQKSPSTSTLIVSPSRSSYLYRNESMNGPIHSRVDPMQLYQSQPRYRDSELSLEKLYGYTDRGLYRPGDTINFAGFTRDMSKLGRDESVTDSFTVTTTIKPITAEEPTQLVENLKLDIFGGFQGSFKLPQEAPLGTYIIDYAITDGPRIANYQHTIQVKEFTNPTYEIRGTLHTDDAISVEVDPRYYFGAPVDKYDATIAATLIPQERCRDCRWYADTEEGKYTNFQFGGGQSARVDRSLTDLEDPVEIPLFTRAELPDPTTTYDLIADLVVIDKRTGERLSKQFSQSVMSLIQITLSGQPIEWVYKGDELPSLEVEIFDEEGIADYTIASWYYEPYGYMTQKGVDGETYAIHGHQMSFLSSGIVRSEIAYPDMENQGTYFLRVQSYDSQNNLLATNEKRIENYVMDHFSRYFGEVQNNTIRNVQGPTKTVEVGKNITLDVNPYVPGTTAIITIERGNRILEVFQRKLDGRSITFPAKELYYPNIHVGIHSVIGEENALIEERKEPRLLQGYAEVSVNRIDTQMNIELTTDQPAYEPGDEAQLQITTTDYAGKPLDARVSVAVIDKSLVDLYHIIKEPIPYFFNKMGTSVGTYTNMRFLYQMLRVYITPGDKGGGGSDVAGRFGQNRDKFLDVAYRKADVYTENGDATVEVNLPDNLTTRVIDTIGISQGTHLGTATKTFVVDKKVKATPYFPQYLTIGDQITFPLSAIGWEGDVHDELIASGTMIYDGRTQEIEFVPSRHNADQRYGALHLPAGMQTGEQLTVTVSIVDEKSGLVYDQLTHQIPIRTKGFIQRSTALSIEKQGSLTSLLSGEIIGGETRIYLSSFPIESRRRVVEYLITYPYGCAEQKMSALLPMLLLPELEQIGAVNEKVYKDGRVKIEQGATTTWIDRDEVIKTTLQNLLTFQASDGGFDYRAGEPKTADYGLSLAMYGGLLQAWKYGYIEGNSGLERALQQVEKYLSSTPPDREEEQVDSAYLMMAWYAADAGRVIGADQLAVVEEAWESMNTSESISSVDHLPAVLLLGIFSKQENYERAQQLANKISWNQLSYPIRKNEIYWNDTSLHGIALQGLSALEKNSSDARVQTDQVLLSLLKLQDNEGLRGRSTQTNMQAFMGLSAFMKAREMGSPDQGNNCELTINGTPYSMRIKKDEVDVLLTVPLDASVTGITSTWSCDTSVIFDQTVQRLPSDISSIQPTANDIDILTTERDEENTTPIGMLDTLSTTFAIDNDAEHLAVEMYLPSTHRFVATTSAEFVGTENRPFEITGNSSCNPDHFEVRYDRLFLYYDSLKAGTRCEVSIQAIKSLTGKVGIMPTHLFEMYRARVFGNTTPVQIINR